ncbi:nuclear transport factor 2 family protein [Pseudophaeobacter sp.]|uniref:ester cyclase n=1 Tax=Pseudophaeobacter sp. TaxID=1971739 RepID=UPI0032981A12
MTMTKRQIVERWFSEIWENRNIAVLDELLSPDLGEKDPFVDNLALRNEIPVLVEVFHNLCGQVELEILVFLEDNEWAAVKYQLTAPGSDKATPIKVDGLMMFRFEGELIAEFTAKIDSLAMFEQLGQMPPDVLLGCFSGQSLTWK